MEIQLISSLWIHRGFRILITEKKKDTLLLLFREITACFLLIRSAGWCHCQHCYICSLHPGEAEESCQRSPQQDPSKEREGERKGKA